MLVDPRGRHSLLKVERLLDQHARCSSSPARTSSIPVSVGQGCPTGICRPYDPRDVETGARVCAAGEDTVHGGERPGIRTATSAVRHLPSMAIDPMVLNDIVAQIKMGRCVAFLGAGVNASVTPPFTRGRQPYDGLPLGAAVASRLSARFVGEADKPFEELFVIDPALEEAKSALLEGVAHETREKLGRDYADLLKLRAYDLPRVALHAEVRVGKKSLVARLKEILKDGEDVEPSLLLRTLARLPFRLIITMNTITSSRRRSSSRVSRSRWSSRSRGPGSARRRRGTWKTAWTRWSPRSSDRAA